MAMGVFVLGTDIILQVKGYIVFGEKYEYYTLQVTGINMTPNNFCLT